MVTDIQQSHRDLRVPLAVSFGALIVCAVAVAVVYKCLCRTRREGQPVEEVTKPLLKTNSTIAGTGGQNGMHFYS